METPEFKMSPRLNDEIYLVQNPALGAILMWEFVKGYKRQCTGAGPSLPFLFLVLPIIFSEPLRTIIGKTNSTSGLRLFAAKFSKEQELLLSIQRRMLALRQTSLSSVSIALDSGLLTLDCTTAVVNYSTKRYPPNIPDTVRELGKHADKLGGWCGALSIQEVQTALRIGF
ncbi:three component ABC system middle component [Pseudomonas marginalis]|uniref:three component ABC system middle component n=1 Tax=Pseudomonas marginalis TaxID=298 RepID=UPI0011B3AAC4|nr:three component ABC system middle component [Pseudomonas marginalis]KAA8553798.1 hypothetical protein FX984_00408 [Pseudomonas marginalis]TWR73166.1 hypothetical protein FIV40_06730 [Pseudomonas marginalis]